ncbi:MAG: benzodiazapine receptor [Kiritimatiellia bacterium]|jgi:translocator protein
MGTVKPSPLNDSASRHEVSTRHPVPIIGTHFLNVSYRGKIPCCCYKGARMKRFRLLALFIILAYIPALSGIFVETGPWYEALKKPPFQPPAWIFGPVWSVLYLLIGLAGYSAWTGLAPDKRKGPFILYGLQLILNGLWSWIFFGLHELGWACLDIFALWLVIFVNMVAFFMIRASAGALLLPYFLWVTFAMMLNHIIWLMNRLPAA